VVLVFCWVFLSLTIFKKTFFCGWRKKKLVIKHLFLNFMKYCFFQTYIWIFSHFYFNFLQIFHEYCPSFLDFLNLFPNLRPLLASCYFIFFLLHICQNSFLFLASLGGILMESLDWEKILWNCLFLNYQ